MKAESLHFCFVYVACWISALAKPNDGSNNTKGNSSRQNAINASPKSVGKAMPSAYGIVKGTFRKQVLLEHNKYRVRHNVAPLIYDSKLSIHSIQRAIQLYEGGKQEKKNTIGENTFNRKYSKKDFTFAFGDEPVTQWYSNIHNYTFTKEPSGEILKAAAPFTRLVWKGSQRLGIGFYKHHDSNSTTIYVVCNYEPHGEIPKQYTVNVLPASFVNEL